jgi:hypothetical protein
MLGETIGNLAKCVNNRGILVVNYPLSPRKGIMELVDSEHLQLFLHAFFIEVDRVGGARSAPLLKCYGVKP